MSASAVRANGESPRGGVGSFSFLPGREVRAGLPPLQFRSHTKKGKQGRGLVVAQREIEYQIDVEYDIKNKFTFPTAE